jgi:hypothetical protein
MEPQRPWGFVGISAEIQIEPTAPPFVTAVENPVSTWKADEANYTLKSQTVCGMGLKTANSKYESVRLKVMISAYGADLRGLKRRILPEERRL